MTRAKRSRTAKISAAAFMAAVLVTGKPALAETGSFGTTSVEVALRTLPPMPKPVIDEVDFSKPVLAPDAYYRMCNDQPEDAHLCTLDKIEAPNAKPRPLSKQDWVNMHAVLSDLYLGFKPTIDPTVVTPFGIVKDKWRYAKDLKGDCEEFAMLFKRIMVAVYGWQEHEILIGVVNDEKKEGHAVAVMRTDRGYLVADVKRNHFRAVEETNYDAVMFQKPENRYLWASMEGRKVFAKKPDLRAEIGPWRTRIHGAAAASDKAEKKRTVAFKGPSS